MAFLKRHESEAKNISNAFPGSFLAGTLFLRFSKPMVWVRIAFQEVFRGQFRKLTDMPP